VARALAVGPATPALVYVRKAAMVASLSDPTEPLRGPYRGLPDDDRSLRG